MIDALPDPVFVKDRQHRWVLLNQMFCEFTGYSRELLVGKSDHDFFPKEQADVFWEKDELVFASGQTHENEEQLTLGGVVRTILTKKTICIDGTGRQFLVGTIRDITARKETENALRASEQGLRLVMEGANVATWRMNLRTHAVSGSWNLEAVLGLPTGMLKGDLVSFLSSLDEANRLIIAADIERSVRERRPFNVEYATVSGQWINTLGKVVMGADGEREEILGLVINRSEAHAARALIEEQRAKMFTSAKLSALGEMAGGIAHEINNPLAIIHLLARQLRDRMEAGALDGELAQHALGRIEATAMRISKIVKSLRLFSRDGEHDPFLPTSVRSVMDDALEICRERIRNHGIELRVSEIPETLMADVRTVQLGQVILNLLGNSVDAVDPLAEKWIQIDVRVVGPHLEITITDSGPGIEPGLRDKILEPFFTTKPVGKGTGLGLSISKRIVESHGGDLRLVTDDPHTRFVITFPLRQPLPSDPVV